MTLDNSKHFFSSLSTQDLPTDVAALAGIVLILLLFKTGKFFAKLLLFSTAVALLAGAYWWHGHKLEIPSTDYALNLGPSPFATN